MLGALCLLLFAADANAQDQGAVYILAPTDTINGPVTEGATINIKVRGYRYTNSRGQTFNLSYRVDDDPALDLVDAKHEGMQKHQFNVGGTDFPGVFDARGDANATLSIPTKPDARCRDGSITVTLLGSYHSLPQFALDVAPKEYTSQLGSGSITIRVKDDPGRCPTISFDKTAEALEKDGVIEGGAFEFKLARQINSGQLLDAAQVTAKWEVEDDAKLDFLASAAEGEKSHQFPASEKRERQTTDISIQTLVDRGAGNGSVKVTLQPSEYYNLTGKTTLTVPVKDDTDFLKRVLQIDDLTVAEDHLYLASTLNFVNGFRLFMQLGGSPATSARDPSVRVSFAEGGGCVATADARDLSKPGGDGRRVPRTSFPQPMVIEWDKERPDARSRYFIRSLMNDQYHEGDETLCVRFDQPKFLRLPGGVDEYFATVTITDDDPPPSIQVDTPSAAEGDGALDFTVTLTNPPQGKDVTVKYHDTRRGSATSGDDYQALPKASAKGVLTFPADKSDTPQESTVSVRIIDDAEVEDEEDVALRFTEPQNADFKSGARGITVIGVISDNETAAPQVRLREAAPGAGPVVVQEGQTAVFHADTYIYKDGKWQIGTIDDQVLILWEVTRDQGSGGAVNRRDFPASFNRFDNIPSQDAVIDGRNGQSGVKLEVPTLSDSNEESIENFRVNLSSAYAVALGATINPANHYAVGTIYDGPTLRIAAPKGPATEGNRLKFPVTLGVAAAADISVAWKTESLAAHSAEAGKDYTAASGTLRFKAGETTKVIRVATLEDGIDEPAEDFSVVLTDPKVAGLDLGPLRAVGIVRDNDKRPAITIGDATVDEGETLNLPITLNPAPAVPVRLEWRVRAPDIHGATRGMDYTSAESGQLTFNAGESSKRLEFPTIDDSIDEATETFEVALIVLRDEEPLFFSSQRDSAQTDILAPITATATILDNDTPSLSIDDVEVKEGGEPVVFTVRLSSPRTYPMEVEFSTRDGGGPRVPTQIPGRFVANTALGAGPAQDYEGVATPRTVRFEPGTTQVKLPPIRVVDDHLPENSEYFQGVIAFKSGVAPKATIAEGVGLARIQDNDTTRYWIANKDTTIREGRDVRIRVKRDRTGFRAQGLIGCLLPTGRHNEPGHAGMLARGNAAPSARIDVFIERKNNPVSVCGQATDGAIPASFSFEADEDEASFWVSTVNDRRKEPDETFIVWFDPTTASGGDETSPRLARSTDEVQAQTVFTILDDDDIHRFRVVSANSPWEGQDAHFDIYVDSDAGLAALKKASNPFVEIKFDADKTDTAKGGVHYTQGSLTRNFDPSSATRKSEPVGRISIPTIGDDVLDGDRTLTISIAELLAGSSTVLPFRPASGGTAATATATIRDDEAYHLSVLDAVGDEGDAAGVKVTLSKPAEQDITIRFRTKEGTAKAPADFTACAAKDARCALVIPAGETEAQLRVPTTEDAVPEETEQFRVVIVEVDFANIIIDRRTAVVKIRDDDARSVAISGLADDSVPENIAWTSPTPAWTGAPDGGVAWTLEGDDAERFTIDPDTGVVTLPAQNFEAPADSDSDNVHDITVRVTDEDGNTAATALSVTVTDEVYGYLYLDARGDKVSVDPNTGLVRAEEGVSVRPSMLYGKRRFSNNSFTYDARRPDKAPSRLVVSRRLTGLGGDGAADDKDISSQAPDGAIANIGWKERDSYSRDTVTLVDDEVDEDAETLSIKYSMHVDNDDILIAIWTGSRNIISDTLKIEIIDNDMRGVTISPDTLSLDEADDPESADDKENIGTYTVVLDSQPAAGTVKVAVESGDTKAATVSPTSLTFTTTTWNAPQTVTVTAVDDATDNTGNERSVDITHKITTTGEGNDYTAVTADPVKVTVTDDDDAPEAIALSVDTDSVDEGAGATTVTVTARITDATRFAEAKTVVVSIGGGTAVSGTDYAAVADFDVTIPAEAAAGSASFTLTPTDDDVDEADETIDVTGALTGATVTKATLSLTDDDTAPTVSVGDATAVAEGDDTSATTDMTFTVALSAASGKAVTLPYTLSGTATVDDDYDDPTTKSVTIAAGDTEADIVIAVKGDTLDEPNETVIVTLGSPVNATVSTAEGAGTGTGTITDDDATPVATLVLTPATINESGATNASTVTARLSGATSAALTLTVSAGTGVTPSANKALTIAAGATASTGTVTLTAVNNALDAVDLEVTVSATASGGNGVADPDDVTLTVTDDDAAPTVSVGDAAAVAEGDDTSSTADMTFTVTLSAASGKVVTVPYTLAGTADAGDDYTDPTTKSVTIAAGATTANIVIPVKGDEVDEPNETVIVTLGSPTNATVSTTAGAGTGTGTITDDDARGVTVTPTSKALTLAEADDGTTDSVAENEASYTVALTSEPTATVTVRLTIPQNAPVTLDKTRLTFTTGNWNEPQTVTVAAVDDAIDNTDDQRTATLAHAVSGGGYGATEDFEVAVTVTDDDAAPTALTLTVDADTGAEGVQASVAEGGGAKTARVTATLAGAATFATATTVTVAVGAAADSATEGTDYAAVADQTLTIAAGERSGHAEFTLTPTQDVLAEGAEAISLDGTATGLTVTGATLSLTDDDAAPTGITLSVSPAAVGEGAGETGVTVTATVNGATRYPDAKTVRVTVGGGTATAGADYAAVSAFDITIAAGAASGEADFDLTPTQDTVAEGAETIDVSGAATGLAVTKATLSLTDDDTAPTLAIADASAAEGDAVTFTVTRAGATGAAATVRWATAADAREGAAPAAAGADYTAVTTARTLSFAIGDTTATFTVATTEDRVDEPNETFLVRLAGATGATVTDDEAVGTITDDDAAPTGIALSVDPTSVAEDAAAAVTVTVTATVSGGTTYADAKTVTVSVGDSADSAVSGTDYAAVSNFNITIPAGAASAEGTFSLDPTDDSVAEGAETLTVSGASGSIAVTDAEVTITDDDATPVATLVLDPASITENAGVSTVTATLSGASSAAVTLTVAAAPVAPAVAGDFTLAGATLTIAAGQTASTGAVTVTAVNNALDAADRTVTVSATAAGGNGVAAPASVTLTITDDDGPPTVSVGDATAVAEGDDPETTADMTFTVTLSAASGKAVTVPYTLSGTAAADADYTDPTTKSVTIAAGDTTADIVIAVTGDEVDEPSETVIVTLGAPANATVSTAEGAGTGTGTITDDDDAPVLAINSPSVAEGNTGTATLTFTVTLSAASGRAVTVAYADAGTGTATSATDYAAVTAGTLAFAAGDTSKTIAVTVNGDTTDEANETVILRLSSPANATLSGGGTTLDATGTITDDDGPPTVSVGDATAVDEGNDTSATTDMTFTVTLSAASGKTVTVPYTLGGTADAGDDYTDPTTKSVTIAAGDTTADIVIPVIGDAVDEPDETVIVTLGTPTNATVSTAEGAGTGTGTITDDDDAPVLAINSPSVAEGNTGTATLTFTVTLSAASGRAVTVAYADAGTGTATSATDYAAVTAGTLAFAAGDTSKTIAVTVNGDTTDEANETVILRLSSPANATLSGGGTTLDATGTITDDDGPPTVSVGDATAVDEGNDTSATTDMTFTVTLSAASGQTVTVPYTLSGDATAGDDYTDPTTKSVTIAAGDTTADITIAVTDDAVDEPDETVIVTLGTPTNATVSTAEGAGTGTGTITDDDTRGVTVAGAPLTLAEADDGTTDSVTENEASYTVVLTSEPTGSVTVAITNPRNSPVTLDTTSLTFTTSDWDDAQTVTVTAADDDIDNAGDERTATLAHAVSGGGYGAAENFSVAVAVTDDDAAGFAFDPASLTVTEGGADGSYAVALASQPTGAVTVTVSAPAGEQVTLDGPDADSAFSRSETVEFTTGNWSRAQTVTVRAGEDDDAAGDTATLSHTASGGGYNAVTGSLAVTVADDDTPGLAFDPASLTLAEGGSGSYAVALATKPSAAVTVTLTAPAGLAVDTNGDAGGNQNTLAFTTANWATGKTVTVTAADDNLHQATARALSIAHAASGGDYASVTGSLAVSVTDDDGAPTLAIADASAAEGDALTFTVTRAGATGAAASLQWATAADAREGAAPAAAGADYTAVTTARTLSFAAGDTTKTFTVATTEDTVDEPDETFLVRLAGATGAAVTDDEAVGTITDDDAAPTGIALSVDPTSVAEDAAAAATVTVTATVSGGTTYADAKTVTVSVGDSGDSAVSGTDYAAVNGFNITIPAGAASAEGTFSLDPTDDSLAEGAETLTVSGASGSIDVTGAEVTIADDEGAPTATLALTPATIDESGATNVSTATATLSAASSEALTLTVSAGAGVTLSSNKALTIAAGQTASTGTVTLTAIDNDVDAADLEVTVSAAAAGGNGVAAPASVTLTIADDDTRGVTVSPASKALTLDEADDGTTDSVAENEASYTVALTSEPTGSVTVAITNPSGSPVTLDKASLTFTAEDWYTAQTVTVTAVDDDLDNPNDRRTATLAHAVSGGGYGASENFNVSVTVTDDDGPPTVSVGDATAVDEGDDGDRTDMTFTVTLSAASGKTVTVPYTLSGTAAADADYADPATKSVTIAAGDTTADIVIAVTGDEVDEPSETVVVTLGAPANATVSTAEGAGTGTGTITDDDATPVATLVLDPASITENAGVSTVTATLSGASSAAVTLTVAAAPVAPAVAGDFTLAGATLTIAAGQTASTGAVTVTAVNNALDAADRTVTVSATAAGGNGVAAPASVTLTITDDDGRGVTVAGAPLTLAEADNSATENAKENEASYTVVLDSEPTATVTVAITNPQNSPVTLDTARLTFTTGNWNRPQTVTVTAVDDSIDNAGDERTATLAHDVSGGGYGATEDFEVAVTVTDDDAAPTALTLTVDADTGAEGVQASVAEGGGAKTARVTATLAGAATFATATTVTVAVGAAADSATEGTDYAAVADQTLTIAAGERSGHAEFTLTPTQDVLAEGAEAISLDGTATGLTVTGATLSLTDDDAAPTGITLSVSPAAVGEGAGETGVTVTATVNGATRYPDAKTVRVTVGGGTATAGADYAAVSAFDITIAAGAASGEADFDLTPTQDTVAEGAETIDVSGAATGLAVTKATLSLTDDDTAPTLAIADASAAEGDAVTFTVTRAGATGAAATVRWATAADAREGAAPAAAGADYTAVTTARTLSFAIGDTTATFTVATTEDRVDEPDETFLVRLAGATGATVTDDEAVGTITDDDDAPTGIALSVDPTSVAEDAAAAVTVTVTATVTGGTTYAAATAVTVSVGDSADSAESGTDYAAVSNFNITIPAGQASAEGTFSLDPTDDSVAEGAETLTVSGASGSIAVTDAEVTIADDDGSPTATLALTPATIDESGATNVSMVTASLSSASSEVLTLTVSAGAGVTLSSNKVLTIAAGQTASAGTVTLTAIDNDVDAADLIVTVSATASGGNGVAAPANQTLTITDDDTRGVTVSPNSLTLAEVDDGTTENAKENEGSYTVVLTSEPTADVTVALTAQTNSPVTLDKTSLTFTAATWDDPQTVTVTAVDDSIDNPNDRRSARIVHAVSGGGYGTAENFDVSVTVTDDDAAPTPTPTATLVLDPATIDESGATNASTVTASLSAASSAALTLTVSAGMGVTLSDNKILTIAAGQTASTGVVTLTAIDNDVDAADLSVTVSATASGGNGVANPANVTLTITDDDEAAITLMPSSIEIPMGGQRAYQVMLSSEPSTTVKVVIEESVDGYVTCAPQELEFTLSDWMKPQTVMVTANGDSNGDFVVQAQDDEDGMDLLELLHTASGNEYEGVKAEMSVEVLAIKSLTPDSLAISVDDAEGPEGDWLEFRVHLSQPSPGGVRVKYRTTSGEAWGLRVPRDDGVNWDERDYDTVDGVLRFDVGEQEKIVRVWARADDGHYDPGETFFFDIYDPVGAALANPNNEYPLPLAPEVMGRVGINSADGKLVWASSRMSRAIGTITGEMPDPIEVSISVNRDVVTEGDDYTIIRVTATAPYGARRSIRIPLTCGGGSAETDDFVCPTGLTIHHGDHYGQAGFEIRQDDDTDDETFTIAIGEPLTTDAAGTNATFVRGAVASVDLTVLDDDSGSVGNDPYDGLTVSIADATAQEGTEDLWFEVTLNRPAPGPVTFHAESESGTARSPNDYQYLARREFRFEEGERMQRLPVWVHDDDIDEGSETMTVKLENPQPANVVIARAVATGTIKNSDPIPGGWLARFGRTVADQAIDGVTDRLRAPRTPGFEGSLSFPGSGGYRAGEPGGDAENGSSMAGAPSPVHAAAGRRRGGSAASAGGTGLPMPFERPPDGHTNGTAGEELSSEKALLRQLSAGSFIHTLEADSAGGTLAWWGKGSQSQFSGRDRSLSLDGDVLTLTLGADYGRGPWVAGAGLLHSIGRGEWSGVGGGELDVSLTSVAPYAAWSLGERLQLWSAAGLGMGSLGVALGEGVDRAERIDTDMGWRMAAAGARGDLLAGTGEGDLAVAVIADAMWSETSSARAAGLVAARAAVSRLRLGLEGSLRARLGSGVSLAPKLELGVRQDGGDAETGRGIYAGAGLALADPNLGIAFDLEGQMLISHDDETFREWGMSASLKFDPRPDSEYGLSLALRQDRGGASSGGMQAMLSPDALPISGFASGSGAADWTVEMSYGLPAFGERFTATPRLSYGLGPGNQEYGLGWQLDPAEGAPDLKLGMRAKRRESIQAPPDHGIEIEAILRW